MIFCDFTIQKLAATCVVRANVTKCFRLLPPLLHYLSAALLIEYLTKARIE